MTPLEWWWWLQTMQTATAVLGVLLSSRVIVECRAEREVLATAQGVPTAFRIILDERRDLAWLLTILALVLCVQNVVNFNRQEVKDVSWWVLIWAINSTFIRLLVVLMAWRRLAARQWLSDALS